MPERSESGEPWYVCNWMSFTRPFLLGRVFFRTALPCSCGYHLGRGGMPLHDAVGINCKNGATSENQDAGVKYIDYEVYVWCLCRYLTWHDYSSLVEGGRHGILLFFFSIGFILCCYGFRTDIVYYSLPTLHYGPKIRIIISSQIHIGIDLCSSLYLTRKSGTKFCGL